MREKMKMIKKIFIFTVGYEEFFHKSIWAFTEKKNHVAKRNNSCSYLLYAIKMQGIGF